MRFPEAKIKDAILHPDPEIRERAVSYFAKSSLPDPTIMPLAIRAIETYGKQDAYRLLGRSRELAQSDTTLAFESEQEGVPPRTKLCGPLLAEAPQCVLPSIWSSSIPSCITALVCCRWLMAYPSVSP